MGIGARCAARPGLALLGCQVRVLAGHERASRRAPVQVGGGDHRRGEGVAV